MFEITVSSTGLSSVTPRQVFITTDSSLATVTTAGWLTQQKISPNVLQPTDLIWMTYAFNIATGTGTTERFTATISVNGSITLAQYVSPGDVTLPVTSGDLAAFDGTTGKIKDSGYSPSAVAGAGRNKVAAVQGATAANKIMVSTDTAGTVANNAAGGTAFNDGPIQSGTTNGTARGIVIATSPTSAKGNLQMRGSDNAGNTDTIITNAAFGQESTLTIPDVGGATGNFIMSGTTNILGQSIAGSLTLSTGSFAATTGNVIAGSSGAAGTVESFPATATTGKLTMAGVSNAGNFTVTVSNQSHAQASVHSLPDPGFATANICVNATNSPFVSGDLVKAFGTAGNLIPAGFNLRANTTAAYAGGGTSNTFTATDVSVNSIVVGVILTSTNVVAIAKIVPGAGDMAVTFTADPGANTVINYIVISNVI